MIVIDTNVTSKLMKPAPSPVGRKVVRGRDATELYTTSITLAEISYGIQRLPHGHRKDLPESAAAEVFSAFEEHVLAFDVMAARSSTNRHDSARCPMRARRRR